MRRRETKFSTTNRGRNDWYPPSWGWQHDVSHDSLYTNDLIIESGNAGLDWSRGGALSDVGGDLWLIRRYYADSNFGPVTFRGDPNGPQDSPLQEVSNLVAKKVAVDNGMFPWGWNPPAPDWALMDQLGTKAISLTIPTAPVLNLAVSLAEFAREGFPKAFLIAETGRSRTERSRNAGDEYLNYQFGWKPLVRDIKNFAQMVVDRERILGSYHKKSGVKLRRTLRFDDETDEGSWDEGATAPEPLLYAALYNPAGHSRLTATSKGRVETWFTATYQYFVPPVNTPERWLSDAQHLLGVKLTPEVLWNLAPWSWAADWVANTGDIMKNLSALSSDSLVISNAYIMRKHTVTYEYKNRLQDAMYSLPGENLLTQSFTTVVKTRRRATPYGFGMNWSDFTPQQLAILTALGVSKT